MKKRLKRINEATIIMMFCFILVLVNVSSVNAKDCVEGMEEVSLQDNLRSVTAPFPYNVSSTKPNRLGHVKASNSTLLFTYYCPVSGKARFNVYSNSNYTTLVGYIITPAAGTSGAQFTSTINVTSGNDYYIEVVPAGSYAHTSGSFNLTY